MSCFEQSCCVSLRFENQAIVTPVWFLSFNSLVVNCESFSALPCSATTNQPCHSLADINLRGADTSMQVL